MWHRVEVVLTDVLEERIASIFRVEGKIRKSAREASVRDVKSRHRRENLKSYTVYIRFSFPKMFYDLNVGPPAKLALALADINKLNRSLVRIYKIYYSVMI
jgi:hypothetical protein